MYLPPAFAVEDQAELLATLNARAFGHLVTGGSDSGDGSGSDARLEATALPFVIDDELTTIRAHLSRANRHWARIDGVTALLIVPGVDAYISPRWYPNKAVDGKVVPTWNYEVVHVHGTIEIHDDADWKRTVVHDLTTKHERQVSAMDAAPAWGIDDAPADYIDTMLKAIVGLEMHITKIEGKRKLSQNRPEVDRLGAVAGLNASTHPPDLDTAARMTSDSSREPVAGPASTSDSSREPVAGPALTSDPSREPVAGPALTSDSSREPVAGPALT